MELISVGSAKAVWLINTLDLNPKGLRILPQLTDALVDTYDFDDPVEDPSKPAVGVKLKDGMFEKDGDFYRVGLEIYDDGLVGDSAHSTELTEEFLNHLLEWTKTNFEIRFDPALLMRKIYFSEVVVRFKTPLATAFKPFATFSQLVAKAIPESVDGFMLSGVTFAARVPLGNNVQAVSIERRNNTGPDANIFYCKAPLPTSEFLKLLDAFDELVSG